MHKYQMLLTDMCPSDLEVALAKSNVSKAMIKTELDNSKN